MGSMDGMVAAVTGASRGIGAAIAKAYAEEGADVIIVARTEQEGGRLPGTIHGTVDQIKEAGGRAVAVKCDVTKDEEVQALAQAVKDQFGRLDVLVNNAGIRVNVPLLDLEFRHWDLTMRVNMHGPFLGCKHLAPIMVEQGGGSIINVTSSAAQNIRPKGVSYSVSKAALDVFTIGLAKELEENDIAVNALSPGPIKTEGAVFTSPPDFDWTGWHPPEVLGPPSIWLAHQTAKTFTGQVVHKDDFGKTWGAS